MSTKDRILDAAIDLFSRRGYYGVPIREIAKNVGIKESSIYNYFNGKDEILTTIFDIFQSEMNRMAPTEEEINERIDSYTPTELWWEGLTSFTALTECRRIEKMFQIILLEMFRDDMARDIALNEFFKKQRESVELIFRKMQERKLISPFDPKLLAEIYTYHMLSMRIEHNLKKNWGLDTEEVKPKREKQIRSFIELLMKYA